MQHSGKLSEQMVTISEQATKNHVYILLTDLLN